VAGLDGAAVAAAAAGAAVIAAGATVGAAGTAGTSGAFDAASVVGAAFAAGAEEAVANCPMGPSSGLRGFSWSRGLPFASSEGASHCGEAVVLVVVDAVMVVVEILGCAEDTRLAVGDDTCDGFTVVVVVVGGGAALVVEFTTMWALVKPFGATTATVGTDSACFFLILSLSRPLAVLINAD